MMTNTGIIIGRMNPPHVWHSALIKKSLRENDKTYIFIGVKKQRDKKNPFEFLQISKWISLIFADALKEEKLFIHSIEDHPSDIVRTKKLWEKVKNLSKSKNITFYWGDLNNDYAITCIQEHIWVFQEYNIKFWEQDRFDSKITINGQNMDISSTLLRQALKVKNKEIVDKIVDKKIVSQIWQIYYPWE